MSGGYADRLKHYPNKGVCGLPENYDSERLLKSNLRALVELVRDAKHLVIMTGAGISTSAGIPDFRGPNGIWTVQKAKDREAKDERKRLKREREEVAHSKKPRSARATRVAEQVAQLRAVVGDGASDAHLEYLLAQARGRIDEAVNAYYDAANAGARASALQAEAASACGTGEGATGNSGSGGGASDGASVEPDEPTNGAAATNAKMSAGAIDFSTATPTLTHRALVELVRRGKVQFVVTQNVDGLDQRAGLPREHLAVLHGCIFEEKCEDCSRIHLRDSEVGSISFTPTGRSCISCGGVLRDTLLDWEDPLPEDELDRSEEHCRRADLVLTLGTSLRIEPAGSLPQLSRRFCVVNLQRTPKDAAAHLIVRAPVDVVMETIMREAMGLTLRSAAGGVAEWVACDAEPAEPG